MDRRELEEAEALFSQQAIDVAEDVGVVGDRPLKLNLDLDSDAAGQGPRGAAEHIEIVAVGVNLQHIDIVEPGFGSERVHVGDTRR